MDGRYGLAVCSMRLQEDDVITVRNLWESADGIIDRGDCIMVRIVND